MSEGKHLVIHHGKLGELMGAVTEFFTTAKEMAEEAKWLFKAGAQFITAHLEVINDPAVRAGRKQVAIMESRDAQSRFDLRRNERELEQQQLEGRKKRMEAGPRRENTRHHHENKEKIEKKHDEIVSAKPVEVEKELKDGTHEMAQETAPQPKREPKKGLTVKPFEGKLQPVQPEVAAAK